ncbi:universal stress protein [Mucilaginibacter paludis]|uniref:UspA domain-containing protein n=1 Tax=Mucilaginibacter paludis DSM 18603 TaxID=714943 RepID=H1YD68_9SPHI|nr:universal stress protein [Mucilaginibacter paludis]EHQ27094.1 UspA domain-containing protein [Mucilaginibacter paludis DSM 18603]
MKTILVLTDFTIRAEHAARYALKLAQKIKADLLLCNIFQVPSNEPMAAQASWPLENYDTLEEDSMNDLSELASRLRKQLSTHVAEGQFKPVIGYCTRSGDIGDTVNEIASTRHVLMVVVSMHGANGLSSFLLGNHASEIIEEAHCPVLVVPYQVPFTGLRKIAFATDLNQNGMDVLNCLAGLAKYSDSEILITHVTDSKQTEQVDRPALKYFFQQVSSKIKYPKMYYQAIENKSVTRGLGWLTQNTDIDLLVMVHRKRNFFQKMYDGSVTQKMADHLVKPMLVFPSSKIEETLPVF